MYIKPISTNIQKPAEGQIVYVSGGVAQYRGGVFYSGNESPQWERPIQWEVTWWAPLSTEK